ncbi:MAG: universal stress protein [Sulfuritalea sp.]|nr:universal stress protein [Sulfuritalea sp.]MBK8118169.1 universal stress protein [Sulfuritalea sp.]
MKILLPVDGSEHSERVARHAILLARNCIVCEILLLNVQPPVDAPEVRGHMPLSEIEAMQQTRGGDAMASTRALLDAAGVKYVPEVALGPVAETIAHIANERQCDEIVMGLRGAGKLVTVFMGSVARDVFALAHCPVTAVK